MNHSRSHSYPAWAEVNLKAIAHNWGQIRRLAKKQAGPGRDMALLTVIKADGYGHGMLTLARLLHRSGVDFLGVSDLREGVQLREAGIKGKVLLLEGMLPDQAAEAIQYDLRPTVYTVEVLLALSRAASRRQTVFPVHIKVDTGMGRLGVAADGAEAFIRQAAACPGIRVEGVMTHFPLADRNHAFTRSQLKFLEQLIRRLAPGITVAYVHAANSMGLAAYPSRVLNLARPGLLLYGLYPRASVKRQLRLRPVLSVKARVLQVKTIRKGDGISYGHSFVAPRAMTVATVPVGYSDGYLRSLSNQARVLVNGRRCPVVGTVTMDQMMVDVSRAGDVRTGQVVTLLGEEAGGRITADELAGWAGTISYEVVCQLGNNLPRMTG